jgi:hypothetical protein
MGMEQQWLFAEYEQEESQRRDKYQFRQFHDLHCFFISWFTPDRVLHLFPRRCFGIWLTAAGILPGRGKNVKERWVPKSFIEIIQTASLF